jgi:hypothetical protein
MHTPFEKKKIECLRQKKKRFLAKSIIKKKKKGKAAKGQRRSGTKCSAVANHLFQESFKQQKDLQGKEVRKQERNTAACETL